MVWSEPSTLLRNLDQPQSFQHVQSSFSFDASIQLTFDMHQSPGYKSLADSVEKMKKISPILRFCLQEAYFIIKLSFIGFQLNFIMLVYQKIRSTAERSHKMRKGVIKTQK